VIGRNSPDIGRHAAPLL